MSAPSLLLRLRYALGRWLVAPVIRLPKRMVGNPAGRPSPAQGESAERALIWRAACALAKADHGYLAGHVQQVAEARDLLRKLDLNAPAASADRWHQQRRGQPG